LLGLSILGYLSNDAGLERIMINTGGQYDLVGEYNCSLIIICQ
jgi:hypothetical protein